MPFIFFSGANAGNYTASAVEGAALRSTNVAAGKVATANGSDGVTWESPAVAPALQQGTAVLAATVGDKVATGTGYTYGTYAAYGIVSPGGDYTEARLSVNTSNSLVDVQNIVGLGSFLFVKDGAALKVENQTADARTVEYKVVKLS